MATFSTNDLKNGMTLDLDGDLMQVVEFQHVKPGKGGAFVRTTLRNARTGAVVDRTFRPPEFITPVTPGEMGLLDPVLTAVHSDPIQPGIDPGLTPKTVHRAMSSQKHLLGDVLGINFLHTPIR